MNFHGSAATDKYDHFLPFGDYLKLVLQGLSDRIFLELEVTE